MNNKQILKIAEKLRSKRAAIRKTIRDMAKESGISRTTLHKWEDRPPANPRRDVIKGIALAYGLKPEDLTVQEEEPAYNQEETVSMEKSLRIIHEKLHELTAEIKTVNDNYKGVSARLEFIENQLNVGEKSKLK
ncbi:hypothetical protein MNBD_NITROSPINAE05-831 [hydrothermal vent metagenome]|uniref:HTH cro/C1-type domain-containing protein n=1 Tax=hydrothermal vent metagenome TaxID=652676 RepID=A0A3B1D5Z3_9ZZZZ